MESIVMNEKYQEYTVEKPKFANCNFGQNQNTTHSSAITPMPIPANSVFFDDSGKAHYPTEMLAWGSQGIVFLTMENNVIKLYQSIEECNLSQEEKIEYLKKIIGNSSILQKHCCIPGRLYYLNHFTGVVMPNEGKQTLADLELSPYAWLIKNNLSQIVLLSISLQIAKVVHELHKFGLMIPDLKGSNLVLNDKGIVRFIDVDGVVLPGWKCQLPKPEYRLSKINYSNPLEYKNSIETDNEVLFAFLFNLLYNISAKKVIDKNHLLHFPEGACLDLFKNSPLPLKRIFLNKIQDPKLPFPSAAEFVSVLRHCISAFRKGEYEDLHFNNIKNSQAAYKEKKTITEEKNNQTAQTSQQGSSLVNSKPVQASSNNPPSPQPHALSISDKVWLALIISGLSVLFLSFVIFIVSR